MFLRLLLVILAYGQYVDSGLTIQSVYISSPVTWEAPPKDPELPKYANAFAALVVFRPSGEFAEADFTIGRYGTNGAIFIIPGEGFAILKGRWSRNEGGSLNVKYQLLYKEKVISKDPVPGPVKEERWVPRGKAPGRLGASIDSPSGTYLPVHAFSNLQTLDDILHEKHPSTIPGPTLDTSG